MKFGLATVANCIPAQDAPDSVTLKGGMKHYKVVVVKAAIFGFVPDK